MARVTYTQEQLDSLGLSSNDKGGFVKKLARLAYENRSGPIREPSVQVQDAIILPITPIGAPRMTQGQMKMIHMDDRKLDKRGIAQKYRILNYLKYKDELRRLAYAAHLVVPKGMFRVYFYLPMPDSWPDKKKKELWGTPHDQKPDLDNLLKGFKDALIKEDKAVWDEHSTKYWEYADSARIVVQLKKENHSI